MPRLDKQQAQQPTEAQLAARAAGAERLRKVNERRRASSVRSTRKDLDTAERKIGQDQDRRLKSTGPAQEALDPPVVEIVDRPQSRDKLELLKFMEEEVTVYIHPTDSPTEVQFPEVWNAGRKQTFVRGKDMRVKRKFVEVLARMKKTSYGVQKVTNLEGADDYIYPSRTGLVYPFVVKDDTSKGRAWLDGILKEV